MSPSLPAMTMSMVKPPARRRVRVWYGDHVIADYSGEAALAERYAQAMSRRFVGLRVTNDPLPPAPPAEGKPAS